MDRNPGEPQSSYPAARTAHLVTTESGQDLLVYDQDSNHIHHLNCTTAAVWALCDGQRSVRDLAQAAAVDEDCVRLALTNLDQAKLLDGPLDPTIRGKVQSRRTFMKKAGIAAIPAIVSITAPIAKAAASEGSGFEDDVCVENSPCLYTTDCCATQLCVGATPQLEQEGYCFNNI